MDESDEMEYSYDENTRAPEMEQKKQLKLVENPVLRDYRDLCIKNTPSRQPLIYCQALC